MIELRINEPGAGAWIMERVEGVFTPGWDHSVSSHRDGYILGGFALCAYLGASITVHMAGDDPAWCTRDLLWMAFHYAFEQLGCRKVIAPVRSDNYLALSLDLRAGFQLEAVVRDAYSDAHMMILTMTKSSCPWLKLEPRGWAPREAA